MHPSSRACLTSLVTTRQHLFGYRLTQRLHEISGQQPNPAKTLGAARLPAIVRQPRLSLSIRCQSSGSSEDSPGRTDHSRAWIKLGIDPAVVSRLQAAYPHITGPTPAQTAFLDALRREKDIYLRDDMGRGKTFILALAALQHAMRKGYRPGTVLILAPSNILVQQIIEHLRLLSPSDTLYSAMPNASARILVTTPRAACSLKANSLKSIFLDEPDAMLNPIPGRHGSTPDHTFFRHPPPLVKLLDDLFGIRIFGGTRDFSHRRNLQTIWVGAGLSANLKGLLRTNAWVRREQPVDLDYLHTTPRPDISHHALSVDFKTGAMEALGVQTTTKPVIDARTVPPVLLNALARMHAASPPPTGSHVLVLPPEGTSLDSLSTQFALLNLDSAVLLAGIQIPDTTILLARRSMVPGLHLEKLDTIYLLHGLDLTGASRSAGSSGVWQREAWYETVTGRLGRLGMEPGGKVVSVVIKGSAEEEGLRRFFDKSGRSLQGSTSDGDAA